MKLVLELMYDSKGVHINYRKKFITIKVDQPKVVDSKNLNSMEKQWAKDNISKLTSAQGIIYRIPKA